jgi:hypothetical protein
MFKTEVFESQIAKLQDAIMNEIRKDRDYEVVNLEAIKTVIQQFICMGFNIKNFAKKINIVKNAETSDLDWKGEKLMHIYDEKFEKHLLEDT